MWEIEVGRWKGEAEKRLYFREEQPRDLKYNQLECVIRGLKGEGVSVEKRKIGSDK